MTISKKNILLFISVISSLFLGFYFNEDSLGGALLDYKSLEYLPFEFRKNFSETFFGYDEYGHRQSPILYIIKSFLTPIDDVYRRFIFLCILLLCPYYFYKCLLIKYPKINKNYIFPISIIIILFPTFRSYSIWPDPHIIGFLFFLTSLFYFLKFELLKINKFKNLLICCFLLSISAYFSPNYGVLIIYYFFRFCKNNLNINLTQLVLFNLILALPFFYYLFILDINFIINEKGWDIGENIFSIKNYSNKILIFFSIFLFYFLPFIIFIDVNWSVFKSNKITIFISLIIFIFFLLNFNFKETYNLTNSGGGFFYNLSEFLIGNNFIFYFSSFLGFITAIYLILVNKWNGLIFIVLILSNPQNTIWQANFSPLIFVLIMLVFFINVNQIFYKAKSIIFIYTYFTGYLLLNIFVRYYLF